MTLPDRARLLKSLRVPTLPALVQRLTQLIDEPNTGTADAGALVKENPPLAGRVLRIANSSFYGLKEPCTSIEQASTVLGLRLLRNVVVQAALIQDHEHLQTLGLDLELLWRNSVLTGRISAMLARHAYSPLLPSPDEAYLTGLLHDIGQVVLLDNLGSDYVTLQETARAQSLPLHLAERRDLGMTHADVGAVVASTWALPNVVRLGIELHHGRRGSDYGIPAAYLAIRAGQILERVASGNVVAACEPVDAVAEKALGITQAAVLEAIQHVRDNLNGPLSEAA
jgi:HD-like signal output (HDOD) protein